MIASPGLSSIDTSWSSTPVAPGPLMIWSGWTGSIGAKFLCVSGDHGMETGD